MAHVSKNEHVCQTGMFVTVHLGVTGLRHNFKALSWLKNQLSLELGFWVYRKITIYLCLLKYF